MLGLSGFKSNRVSEEDTVSPLMAYAYNSELVLGVVVAVSGTLTNEVKCKSYYYPLATSGKGMK
jgi:hypothetical protein